MKTEFQSKIPRQIKSAKIKGHEVKYYLDMINEVRQKTIEELKKKDDKWLLAIDPEWSKER